MDLLDGSTDLTAIQYLVVLPEALLYSIDSHLPSWMARKMEFAMLNRPPVQSGALFALLNRLVMHPIEYARYPRLFYIYIIKIPQWGFWRHRCILVSLNQGGLRLYARSPEAR